MKQSPFTTCYAHSEVIKLHEAASPFTNLLSTHSEVILLHEAVSPSQTCYAHTKLYSFMKQCHLSQTCNVHTKVIQLHEAVSPSRTCYAHTEIISLHEAVSPFTNLQCMLNLYKFMKQCQLHELAMHTLKLYRFMNQCHLSRTCSAHSEAIASWTSVTVHVLALHTVTVKLELHKPISPFMNFALTVKLSTDTWEFSHCHLIMPITAPLTQNVVCFSFNLNFLNEGNSVYFNKWHPKVTFLKPESWQVHLKQQQFTVLRCH